MVGRFFWSHTLSRAIFDLGHPGHRQLRRHRDTPPFGRIADLEGGPIARFALAAHAAVADLVLGLLTLFLLAVGSGMYVRRFDNWLHARTSGQAVAFRGQDLTAATLDANTKRQRGVLR